MALSQTKSFQMSPQQVLYKVTGGRKRLVVPLGLVTEVIRLHHDLPTAGHAGAAKTLSRIKEKFWWERMDSCVEQYVRRCKSCSQRTNYGRTKAPLGNLFNEPKVPFEVIAADIVGPLPLSESGNRYILSVMDHFTRYCEFIALSDQTAEQIARALVQKVITKYGVPKALITDQGASFTGDLIKQICKFLRVRKVQTTGFHPQSNGRLERVHSTITRMLSHFVNRRQTDWDEYLPYVTMAYNSQEHESTGFSPFELLFGRKMEAPLEADLKITDDTERYIDHVEDLRAKLKESYEVADRRKISARKRNENQYNKKAKEVGYKVGQSVMLHVPSIGRHRVRKLSKLWRGPYEIVRVLSPYNVVLRVRNRDIVVHVNRVKPCLSAQEPASVPEEDEVSEENDDDVVDEALPGPSSAPTSVVSPSRGGRPGRDRRPPARYRDFVVCDDDDDDDN